MSSSVQIYDWFCLRLLLLKRKVNPSGMKMMREANTAGRLQDAQKGLNKITVCTFQ